MADPNLILFCKMESDGDIGAPSIGTGASTTGSRTYSPVKFNNGMSLDSAGHRAEFPVVIGSAFFIDLWVKLSAGAQDVCTFDIYSNKFYFSVDVGEISVGLLQGGSWTALYTFTPTAWSAGDIVHFQLRFNSGASDKIILIQNAITKAVASKVVDTAWAPGTVDLPFYRASGSPLEDNIKVVNSLANADAYVTNRDVEEYGYASVAPSAPGNLSASDGTYSTHIAITWDASSGATDYNLYKSADGITFAELSGWQAGTSFTDTDIEKLVQYSYKVKARNGAGESGFSNTDTGYAKSPVIPADPVPEQPSVKCILINNVIDIYALGYVSKLVQIKESKSARSGGFILNEISIKVSNHTEFFSVDNVASPFKTSDYYLDVFKLYFDGELIWDGIIKKIQRNHKAGIKDATIVSTNKMYNFFNQRIEYESSAWETPVDAFKNLLSAYAYSEYDTRFANRAKDIYIANSCYIKCNFNLSDDITLQQALEKIADYGCAYIYYHKSTLYYKHYEPFARGVNEEVRDNNMTDLPVVDDLEKDMINDYSITYTGCEGVAVKDSDGGNNIGLVSRQKYGARLLTPMPGDADSQITFKDKTSAIYIGECHIKRMHKNLLTAPAPLTTIELTVDYFLGRNFDLNTYFRLTFPEEGWVDKIFEIFELTFDYDKTSTKIYAREVDHA